MFLSIENCSWKKTCVSKSWWVLVICMLTLSPVRAGQSSAHIPSLNATVDELVFYESAFDIPPVGDRVYDTEFLQSQVRYICWELRMKHPNPGRKIHFRVEAKYFDPKGALLTEHYIDSYLNPDWSSSHHSSGHGSDNPGNFWVPGTYRVDVYIAGDKVASGNFEVVLEKDKTSIPKEQQKRKTDMPDDLGEL